MKDLRIDKDFSQTEMAELLKCAQTSYSQYERGVRDIPTEMIIELCKIHNISADYLLGLTDEPRALR